MVQAIRAFLEFCYLARRDVHDEDMLHQMDEALKEFRVKREIFRETGVRADRPGGVDAFSLPRQHWRDHYKDCIWEFGSPNGLCSSITESKHIKAVKEPWRRSNRDDAIGQMLITNQRLDKLAAARVDFTERRMLENSSASFVRSKKRVYSSFLAVVTILTFLPAVRNE